VKYAWITQQASDHSLSALCRALGVSSSGFYHWRSRAPSTRAIENARLALTIQCVHREYREAYGTERLWRELRDRGEQCGRHRVARLRRRHGVVTKRRHRCLRARAPYQFEPPAPNRLRWPFHSPAPNRIWVTDITYVPTRQGWLYLAVVLDLFARRVIGWAMSTRQDQELASSALMMAIDGRRPPVGLIHHSDRGSLYTSKVYRKTLERHGITASMSRVGMPYDNAAAESFFSSLKNELTHHEQFATIDEARHKLFDYIEVFYNRQHKHQSLGYRSPVEFERLRIVA
jgi:putative transposase